jgi:hypothetical protein
MNALTLSLKKNYKSWAILYFTWVRCSVSHNQVLYKHQSKVHLRVKVQDMKNASPFRKLYNNLCDVQPAPNTTIVL